MKTLLLLALLTAVALPHASADIILGGPGVPVGNQVADRVPFRIEFQLTGFYKFVLSGITAKGDTLGAPGASGTEGNGGQFHMSASVFDNKTTPTQHTGDLYFNDVQDYNTSPLQTLSVTPSVIYKAIDTPITITLVWTGEGNAHKPNGTFTILGEFQKNPPIPVGKLFFDVGDWLLVEAGSQPDGVATITRD